MADGGELIVMAPGVNKFGEDPGIDSLIRKVCCVCDIVHAECLSLGAHGFSLCLYSRNTRLIY